MQQIYEPRWCNNGSAAYTTFLCTECRKAVGPNERYLVDAYNQFDKVAPRLCGRCGLIAIAKTKARRERKNRAWLKVEQCPNCHTPYPLALEREPSATHNVTLACRAMRLVEAIAVEGGIDYACGCKERPKKWQTISHCPAHQYGAQNESWAGCCYNCEYPLTADARRYNRLAFAASRASDYTTSVEQEGETV